MSDTSYFSMFLLRKIRWIHRGVKELDKLNLWPLRILPSRAKRLLIKQFFGLFTRSLAEAPLQINELSFYVPPNAIRGYAIGDFEQDTQQIIMDILKPKMIAIDIGANIGYFTLLMAKAVGEKGKIYAVEPAADNLEYLQKNIELNGLSNVKLLPYAAGAVHQTREFYLRSTSTMNSFYVSTPDSRVVQVNEIPLDEIVEGQVDFIKIDVEGAEVEALRGMRNILAKNKQIQLIIEWSPRLQQASGYSVSELPQLLLETGFTLSIVGERDHLWQNLEQIQEFLKKTSNLNNLRVNLYARRIEA